MPDIFEHKVTKKKYMVSFLVLDSTYKNQLEQSGVWMYPTWEGYTTEEILSFNSIQFVDCYRWINENFDLL